MKKILFIIIAAIYSLTSLAQEVKSPVITCRGNSRTVDIRDFYSNAGNVFELPFDAPERRAQSKPEGFRWIDRIYNLPDFMYTFYENYGDKVSGVLKGESNCLSDPTLATNMGQDLYAMDLTTIKKTFTVYFPTDAPGQLPSIVANAVRDTAHNYFNEIDCFMPYLFMCLSFDYPQAFWIGNNYTWFESYGYQFTYWMQGPNAGTCKVDLEYHANYLVKSTGFDLRIDEFQSDSTITEGVALFNSTIDSISVNLPLTTRCAQIIYLNDWLTTHNCYSTALGSANVPTIVWSPMSAIKGSTGSTGPVCEGYARAFKVLCDRIGIPNILAVGFARTSQFHDGEAHMWNEVQMDDELWYGVDVTWNDPVTMWSDVVSTDAVSGFENNDWLLVGKKTVINGLAFEESHPNSISVNSNNTDKWSFSNESLLTDRAFDISDIVINPIAEPTEPVNVYSITGVLKGSYNTIGEALTNTSPGLYIIGNRKIVIK